ncbi:MAG: hypothetical protein JXB10_14775 [Pirellulales bacterium]|nr:hypothetical protein [Pirellulales bacterium]
MPNPTFTIRIKGYSSEINVSPETVSAGNLAYLIGRVEKSIIETHSQDHPLPESALISLVAIEQGSNVLVFSIEPELIEAATTVTAAIRTNHFEPLLRSVQDNLHDIWKLTRRLNWIIQFAAREVSAVLDAMIHPDHKIPPAPELAGVTTIYGQCIRVGGDKHATAQIRLINGKIITVKVSLPLAKKLANHLYCEVGLEGEAFWNASDFEILRFEVNKLLPYRAVSLEDSFNKLYQAGGNIWDNIDAEQFIHEIRAN